MLFEGVYLYLKLVKVFNTEVRMRLFLAVAWGTFRSICSPSHNVFQSIVTECRKGLAPKIK